MMYNYPFFSFPHFRRYSNYYPASSIYTNPMLQSKVKSSTKFQESNIYSHDNKVISHEGETNLQENRANSKNNKSKREGVSERKAPPGFGFLNNFLHQEDRGDDESFFELFGIKLYQDDLLLLGLIFFLYKEDVKDQYLFFALILLLLS